MKFKLRPKEIVKLPYWIHIILILLVIYIVMGIANPSTPIGYFFSSLIGLVLGDIIAHTLLKLD